MNKFVSRFNSFVRDIGAILFTPPARRPSPHCTNINMLLMHLCDFDADRFSYILQWLAFPLKNPGAKMCYGLIINGDQDTGKNLFFQHVAAALHSGEARIVHADTLHSHRFTSWIGAPLVVVDGNVTQRGVARVKELMTAGTVNVHRSGSLACTVPNRMNFVFLSGDINPLRLDVAERRFLVIDAPPARERAFYQAVEYEIKSGGVDAFREYLMHGIDLAGFNESTMPPGMNRSGSNRGRVSARQPDPEAA